MVKDKIKFKYLYIKFFSVCYSYEKKRDPYYFFISSVTIFSAILTLILTFLLLLCDFIFILELSNVLASFILSSWFGLIFFNYYFFKKKLNKGKLQEDKYESIKKKYYIFVSFGLLHLVFILVLLQIIHERNELLK